MEIIPKVDKDYAFEEKHKGKSVKYTRRHYVEIGDLIKKLPESEKRAEFNKWNSVFKADNPRYDEGRFKKHIGL